MLISCQLVVWRMAQILNKKYLSFWADAIKNGSALVISACYMLAKTILFFHHTDKKQRVVLLTFLTKVDMKHKTEFTNTDFAVLKFVKKLKNI